MSTTYNSMRNKGFIKVANTGNGLNHGGGDQLSDTQYLTIKSWINAGAKND